MPQAARLAARTTPAADASRSGTGDGRRLYKCHPFSRSNTSDKLTLSLPNNLRPTLLRTETTSPLPSPFRPAAAIHRPPRRHTNSHLITMAPQLIEASEISKHVSQWAVWNGKCHCGWYYFYYAGCGHVRNPKYRHCCGETLGPTSGQVVFCFTPAPCRSVSAVGLNGLCPECSP